MSKAKHIAIVGATGAVGAEMLECLEQRDFPVSRLRLLASSRSAGRTRTFRGEEVEIEELTEDSFGGVDIALFSAGASVSKGFAPFAVAAGATVVDNSSAYRMQADVPLVIPELNPQAAAKHQGIIANPNCTTIVSLMALAPLHKAFGVRRVFASSYQAVSGSGAAGMKELEQQVEAMRAGGDPVCKVYPCQIAFNVIPQVDAFTDNGYTREEMKFVNESRKILNLPDLKASITCVRVPVYRSHSVAISAEFERLVDLAEARRVIDAAPGVDMRDDPAAGVFPTPLDVTGRDECLVGRLRRDLVFDNGLTFWVVGDQVRKGAALNAVQIAELL